MVVSSEEHFISVTYCPSAMTLSRFAFRPQLVTGMLMYSDVPLPGGLVIVM